MPRSRFRCVVFDFDGVLVDSNALKRDAYFTVFGDMPGAQPSIENTLSVEIEGDRYDVIRSILAALVRDGRVSPERAGEGAVANLAQRYNQICEEAVAVAPEVAGCTAMLRRLAPLLPLYINSATPDEPLRRIVNRRKWTPYFKGVFGRPGTKVENLETILRSERVPPEALAFVGDGLNDQAASRACGCAFIAMLNGSTRFDAGAVTGISDLSQLPALIVAP